MKNLLSIFLFGIFFLAGVQAHAFANEPMDTTPFPKVEQQGNGVFVHITAQIKMVKRTSQGIICEIISLREGKVSNPGKNEITGSMRLKAGKLQMKLDQKNVPLAAISMDHGWTFSESLSKKLGASSSVVMSGGTTMVRKRGGEALLHFEIQ